MERVLIGTGARWFIDGVEIEALLEGRDLMVIGIDLAPGPELLPAPLLETPRRPAHLLRGFKQSAPTTARELRRAEKRRRR